MRFAGGYLEIGSFFGAPIRLHWSIPLGALLISRGRFAPGVWIALFALILLHEMGHAVLVRARGLHLQGLDVQALGGLCRYGGMPSQLDVSIIAWGGVLTQLVVLAIAWPLSLVLPPRTMFVADVYEVLTWTNLMIIGLNLIPVAGFDGVEAWKLWGLWRKRRPRAAMAPAIRRPSHLRVVAPPEPPSEINAEMRRVVEQAARDERERQRRNRLN